MKATAAGADTLGVQIELEDFRKAISLREADNLVTPGSKEEEMSVVRLASAVALDCCLER